MTHHDGTEHDNDITAAETRTNDGGATGVRTTETQFPDSTPPAGAEEAADFVHPVDHGEGEETQPIAVGEQGDYVLPVDHGDD